jgi:hypothetical protein
MLALLKAEIGNSRDQYIFVHRAIHLDRPLAPTVEKREVEAEARLVEGGRVSFELRLERVRCSSRSASSPPPSSRLVLRPSSRVGGRENSRRLVCLGIAPSNRR